MDINNADHMSAISFGGAFVVNRNVFAKKNQVFGQQIADRVLRSSSVNMTLDEEVLDKTAISRRLIYRFPAFWIRMSSILLRIKRVVI